MVGREGRPAEDLHEAALVVGRPRRTSHSDRLGSRSVPESAITPVCITNEEYKGNIKMVKMQNDNKKSKKKKKGKMVKTKIIFSPKIMK